MNTPDHHEETKSSIAVWAVVAYVVLLMATVAAVILAASSLGSLSGELPVDDPTPDEQRTWQTGLYALWAGIAGAVLTTITGVIAGSRMPKQQFFWAAGLAAASILVVVIAAVATWAVVLPPLPS
ncbi:hypothetical protein F6J84_11245 [Microbacterium caowuchunii]|uniref:hypothetical protein n=1 Tax=Microbacterium caowuchunii TaxID=2614638 RepID=UPI0012444C7A|nr:hypothetical protein [Microbacterium caowuchunii]QEW00613.1 hypothetical protein F6J84_11245 [Microbacterium caowuchunii]